MDPQLSSPIQKLPLHVIAGILAQLDTVAHLGSAILSHRIFNEAFREAPRWIVNGIVPDFFHQDVLPFVVALQESTKIPAGDAGAVRSCLLRLEYALSDPEGTAISLDKLTLSDFACLKADFAAVKSLTQHVADHVLPFAMNEFEIERSSTLTAEEKFRLHRAFLRYQLMCNMFCVRFDKEEDSVTVVNQESMVELDEVQFELFFGNFPPWVNEQVFCIHKYLQRMACKAMAFDVSAAPDVVYGSQCLEWYLDVPEHQAEVQGFLRKGLPFLSSVVSATTDEERCCIMKVDALDEKTKTPHDHMYHMGVPYKDSNMVILPEFQRLSVIFGPIRRGPQSSIPSTLDRWNPSILSEGDSPIRVWAVTCSGPIRGSAIYNYERTELHDMLHILWDLDAFSMYAVGVKFHKAREREKINWEEVVNERTAKDVRLSIQARKVFQQRKDIRAAGGRGVWPWPRETGQVFDFSRIEGLSEKQKRDLVGKWQQGAVSVEV